MRLRTTDNGQFKDFASGQLWTNDNAYLAVSDGSVMIGTSSTGGAKLNVDGNIKLGNFYLDANQNTQWLYLRDQARPGAQYKGLALGDIWIIGSTYLRGVQSCQRLTTNAEGIITCGSSVLEDWYPVIIVGGEDCSSVCQRYGLESRINPSGFKCKNSAGATSTEPNNPYASIVHLCRGNYYCIRPGLLVGNHCSSDRYKLNECFCA